MFFMRQGLTFTLLCIIVRPVNHNWSSVHLMNQPSQPQIPHTFSLDTNEFGKLTFVSERFGSLCIILLNSGAGHPAYDSIVAELQREREFIARFSEAARIDRMRPPIEALDLLAKKIYPEVAFCFISARECALTNLFFQRIIRTMLRILLEQNKTLLKSMSVNIDPSKLH